MPCRSDYLEPTARERESVRVLELLREIRGEDFDHDKPHSGSYGSISTLDKDTAELCSWCSENLPPLEDRAPALSVPNAPYTDYIPSLELQIWWRKHQKADRERERIKEESKQRRIGSLQAELSELKERG